MRSAAPAGTGLGSALLRLSLIAPILLVVSAWAVVVLAETRTTSPAILAVAIAALVLQLVVSAAWVGAALWRARPAWRRHRLWLLPLCALGVLLVALLLATGGVLLVTESGLLGLMPR